MLRGLERDDLFTVVFEQVLTDTVPYADVVLPATTFLEHYDFSSGYGPITMQLTQPVVEPIGEARSNADVFNDLGRRLGLFDDEQGRGELDSLLRVLDDLPAEVGSDLKATGVARPPGTARPCSSWTCSRGHRTGKCTCSPTDLDREAPAGLYAYQPDPATDRFPLALISPASDRTISSTLGELPRPEVRVADPSRGRLGETDRRRRRRSHLERAGRSPVPGAGGRVDPAGNGGPAEGAVAAAHRQRLHRTALAPATLTDIGGGACFNDARVQVERAGGRKPAPGSA